MAAGETYWFVGYLKKVFENGIANFSGSPNTLKCALIKSAANGGHDPSIADAHPTWGASGTTNLSAAEITAGGNYTAGGEEVASPVVTIVGDVLQLDWGNPPTWSQDAANPTNARWAIFYDNTTPNKEAVCFYDLGTDRDMTSGELQLSMGTPALDIDCSP